jgi:hypothetical protein
MGAGRKYNGALAAATAFIGETFSGKLTAVAVLTERERTAKKIQ